MEKENIREIITDALRYWERRRLIYNLLLLGITFACLAHAVTHRPNAIAIDPVQEIPLLLLLALTANALYCTAYIPDIFVQLSLFRPQWRRWRWLLFVLGCLISAFFTYEIASALTFSNDAADCSTLAQPQ